LANDSKISVKSLGKILVSFLKEHGSEVHNMLLSEWNIDDAKRVWQREAREEGRNEEREKLFTLLESGVSLAEAKKILRG
jgi:hypothetical protein